MAPFLLTEKIVSGDLEGTQALEVLSEMKLTVIDTFSKHLTGTHADLGPCPGLYCGRVQNGSCYSSCMVSFSQNLSTAQVESS